MIASIKGIVTAKGESYVVVENQGIGYKVAVGAETAQKAVIDQDISLFTHHHIKEDAFDLYGFGAVEDRDLFVQLISISGVGPKTALNVFAVASATDIKSAIIHQDSSLLKKVSGIGAKTADRIVLELKNKIGALESDSDTSDRQMHAGSEVMDALLALGYTMPQAREATRNLKDTEGDISDKVKEALKFLGSNK